MVLDGTFCAHKPKCPARATNRQERLSRFSEHVLVANQARPTTLPLSVPFVGFARKDCNSW